MAQGSWLKATGSWPRKTNVVPLGSGSPRAPLPWPWATSQEPWAMNQESLLINPLNNRGVIDNWQLIDISSTYLKILTDDLPAITDHLAALWEHLQALMVHLLALPMWLVTHFSQEIKRKINGKSQTNHKKSIVIIIAICWPNMGTYLNNKLKSFLELICSRLVQ